MKVDISQISVEQKCSNKLVLYIKQPSWHLGNYWGINVWGKLSVRDIQYRIFRGSCPGLEMSRRKSGGEISGSPCRITSLYD